MKEYSADIICRENRRRIINDEKKNLLEILRAYGPEYFSAPCGGKGSCGKCRIHFSGAAISVETGEKHFFTDEEILACRYFPAGDCIIKLTPPEEAIALSDDAFRIEAGAQGWGIAADIGTTTIAVQLFSFETGRMIAEEKELNSQISYGADVLSRLEYAAKEGHGKLADCLQSQLADMAQRLCARAGIDGSAVSTLSLCANTIMEHFAAGLDPAGIAVPPFEGKSLFGSEFVMPSKLAKALPSAKLLLSPCVAGYVGGDVVSGLAAVEACSSEELMLYLDIGTNGEMALGDKNGFCCCAAAAGPAFEGAELSCGMAGAKGAIDRVEISGEDISVHVIGGGEARGVCGSGVIDAVAAMLELKVISKSGRFAKASKLPGPLARRIETVDGIPVFMLKDGVYLSLKDIRNVQLAKAAIRAGAETLMKKLGKTASDISKLVVAGGFGSSINIRNAAAIGLLPEVGAEKSLCAGNAALKGAAQALTSAGWEKQLEMARLCCYTDLSSNADFPALYLENINFR